MNYAVNGQSDLWYLGVNGNLELLGLGFMNAEMAYQENIMDRG